MTKQRLQDRLRKLSCLVVGACALLVPACRLSPTSNPAPSPTEAVGLSTAKPIEDRIRLILEDMSLEEKVGQLMMPHVYGGDASNPSTRAKSANERLYGVDNAAELVRSYKLGGIILIGRNPLDADLSTVPTENIGSPKEVRELTNDLQSTRGPPGLLIAIDQENGPIRRIEAPLTKFPSNMSVGAAGEVRLAYDEADVTGRELRVLGINLNLAPVADVNTESANPVIGLRSFGSDPQRVADLVSASIRGYHHAGIASAAKHFPGHGGTTVDSHEALPVIKKSIDDLRAIDLVPFAAAVKSNVDVVMAGHLSVPVVDAEAATLSKPILTGLLREGLGFNGVIATDSLWMKAIRGRRADTEIALASLQAGADILVMPPDLKGTIDYVVRAVRAGQWDEGKLDASVMRVLTLKDRWGVTGNRDDASPRATLGSGTQVAREIAARAVAAVGQCIETKSAKAIEVVDATDLDLSEFKRVLSQGGAQVRELTRSGDDADAIVVVVDELRRRESMGAMIEGLARERPTVVIHVGSPYSLGVLPDSIRQVLVFDLGTEGLQIAARGLIGEVPLTGILPVEVRAKGGDRVLYEAGHRSTSC